MRQKKAKAIRRAAENVTTGKITQYEPFRPWSVGAAGSTVRLTPTCGRAVYRNLKRQYREHTL